MSVAAGQQRATTHADAVAAGAVEADPLAYIPRAQATWLAERPEERWRVVDGSMVFADVSGFTPLTERLARRGRVGAEMLTDVLNDVFSTLLGVSSSFGGDLLKFGGDALFLLFTGHEHERRACAAAHAMQTALRPYRRLTTPGGQVSLRMSVGIDSGPIHLFLVGGSHRELLVAGPTVSSTAALESAAAAGQVLLGHTTAAALGAAGLGAPKGPGVLLRRAPRLGPVLVPPDPTPPHPWLAVPVSLRDHLGRLAHGEHRRAVLTFVQFTGTDDLLASSGPSAVADALDRIVRTVQEACETHGVCFLASDVDRNGGKILLAAGAPTATPDDADRMLFALRAVVEASLPLPVRAGVNLGRAFAVDVGAPDRRTFAVMGDPTNLAARVMGKADPGGIVATQAVIDGLRAQFQLQPLEPFTVKGKSVPVHAQVVGPVRGLNRREERDLHLPLIGRAPELARLRVLVDAARAGTGGVVELVGEAGIGKSRLVAETVAASGLRHFALEGAQYAISSPYHALRGPLRRLLGVAVDAPDEEAGAALTAIAEQRLPSLTPWLPILAPPFGAELPATTESEHLEPAFRRTLMQRLVVGLIQKMLPGPALVTVEDAHWLDAASSDMIQGIVDTAGDDGWAVLVTRRDGPTRLQLPDSGVSLALGPLDSEAIRELLRQIGREELLSPSVLDAVAEQSGGHPLFLEELLSVALANGYLEDVPDTVEALIAARIDTLPPTERLLLRYASVLGAHVDVELLGDMLASETRPRDLQAAIEDLDGFLVPDDRHHVRFQHALLRDVAYEGLPFKVREQLHGRAGDLVEARAADDLEGWCDLLSFHFSAGSRHEAAWTYSRMAGDHARDNAASVDAAVFYERALRAARHLRGLSDTEIAAVNEQLGDVCELGGQYERAAEAYRQARRYLSDDKLAVAELCRKEGWLRERSSRYSQALRWYTRAFRQLEDVTASAHVERLRAQISLAYGAARLRQGRYREAVELLKEAVRGAETVGDRATLARAYYNLDSALTDAGDREAERYRSLALPIYEELGDFWGQANVLNNLGVDAYFEGRWDDALQLYERSRVARERSGDVVQYGTAANNIGEILCDQGHLDEGERLLREALAIYRAAPWPTGVAIATSSLGRAAARGGRHPEADHLLRQAADGFRDLGAEALLLDTELRRAELAVLAGDAWTATTITDEVLQRASRIGATPVLLAMCHRIAGYAAAQLGDLATARAELERSLDTGTAADALFEIALTLEAFARIDPDDQASAQRAREILERLAVVRTPEVPLDGTPTAPSEDICLSERRGASERARATPPASDFHTLG